ncbi:hypothetical protein ACPCTO_37640 [Streptomyces olivoreticuli]
MNQQPTVYQPQPFTLDPTTGALVASGQGIPGVYTITAPDGTVRHVYGPPTGQAPVLVQPAPYLQQAQPVQQAERPRHDGPLIHPWLANAFVGALILGGITAALHFLIGFMAALAHLLMTLVVLLVVLAGTVLVLRLVIAAGGGRRSRAGTTVNIKKAVFKRSTFRG